MSHVSKQELPRGPGPCAWTTEDSSLLYQVQSWGQGYFSVNGRGHVQVSPCGGAGRAVSLFDLAEDLRRRGYQLPVLVRFPEILADRLGRLCAAFERAISEYAYEGSYRPIYPIKVNQQRDVLDDLLGLGKPHGLGLEAGSKPELLVALAQMHEPDGVPGGVIVCNGFKDSVYIEIALLAQRLGRYPILVVERFEELERILALGSKLGLEPHIGVRARLSSRGAGRWLECGGDRSKFGLSASELVAVVERLEREGQLSCLELLHFHVGSQITDIRAIKDALRECSRIFVDLSRMGAGMKFLDVGGGLGVDYDGSKTSTHSSTNYSLQEYANDVVYAIGEVCQEQGVPQPQIFSESGRALTAYHSVLIFDVLGTHQVTVDPPLPLQPPGEGEESTLRALFDTWQSVSAKNLQESYHDALELKEEASSLFNLGYLDLQARARVEELFWATCLRIHHIVQGLEHVPEELQGLEKSLADIYFCNFSVFQSVPDLWAVDQLFPVMPIHRLEERPTRKGTLADLTCDSDGKVDQFIDMSGRKGTLELHAFKGSRPYYLAMFLVGAYQETLGDLHNLFGDTTAIHVSTDEHHGYKIDRVIEGDTVNEVLGYVQYERRDLTGCLRTAAEAAVRKGNLEMEQSALLLKRCDEGLQGYTYLSREQLDTGIEDEERPGAGATSRRIAELPSTPPSSTRRRPRSLRFRS